MSKKRCIYVAYVCVCVRFYFCILTFLSYLLHLFTKYFIAHKNVKTEC